MGSTLVTYFASVDGVGAGVDGRFYFKEHKWRVGKDRRFLSKGCTKGSFSGNIEFNLFGRRSLCLFPHPHVTALSAQHPECHFYF
jgi:hypothetical protein